MNKRIIFNKDDNYGSFHLEEYYPYKRDNHVILDKDDKLLNTKSIKIEIDCPIIDKAIEFLQECKKELKEERT
ncbi:hypothetical protein [Spiroplasma endosymbiont of Sarcophaga variegata]|uniref:hypothetical protein n=1 Tax=Spiroplasma endosymbiont of Sarcophaga variegata TaxID=3066304 RepID=UPI003AF921EE